MDATLAQILVQLFETQVEVQRLAAENQQLRQVIDDELPVQESGAPIDNEQPND